MNQLEEQTQRPYESLSPEEAANQETNRKKSLLYYLDKVKDEELEKMGRGVIEMLKEFIGEEIEIIENYPAETYHRKVTFDPKGFGRRVYDKMRKHKSKFLCAFSLLGRKSNDRA